MPPSSVVVTKRTAQVDTVVDVQPVDLSRPVSSLAENVSTAMAALYSLHIALSSVYGELSPFIIDFTESKQNISQQWEEWLLFLQDTAGYARDYVTVCQSLQTGDPAQHTASATAVLKSAQSVRNGLSKLKLSYTQAVHQFVSRRYEPAQVSSVANVHRISEAFKSSSAALQKSLTSAEDIHRYWEAHVSNLAELSRSPNMVDSGHFREETAKWIGYHDSLVQAIDSISSSCDALMVAPINQSNSWLKTLSRFLPRWRDIGRQIPSPSFVPVATGKQDGGYKVLNNPMQYNILTTTQVTYTIHACLHIFFKRISMQPGLRSSCVEGLLVQADRYFLTLNNVESVIATGIEICRNAQWLTCNQEVKRAASSMHDGGLDVSKLITAILIEYEQIDEALQRQIALNADARRKINKAPYTCQWRYCVAKEDIKRLKDGELLLYTETVLNRLVQLLKGFNSFWSQLVSDVEYFYSRPAIGLTYNRQIFEGWRDQENALIAYRTQVTNGQRLDQTRKVSLADRC